MQRELCLCTRYYWSEKKINCVYAQTEKLFSSMQQYLRLNAMSISHYTQKQSAAFDELMVGAMLAAASQVERDYWGWTLRLPFADWGLFCAVDPEGMVCGKISPLSKEQADVLGKVSVQRQLAEGPLRQSNLIPDSESAILTLEQYFTESEQLPARFAIQDLQAVMFLSMPDAAWGDLAEVSQSILLAQFHEALATDKLEKAYEYVFFYDCRCSEKQMRTILGTLPVEEQDYVWGEDGAVQIECPRCSKRYHLVREP